jgi:hypothetical protein
VQDIETRMAKLSINSNVSGGSFVVYLREVRGIPRNNLSVHAAWEPGATHFGLVVPDAQALWARLQEASMLRARSGAKCWSRALARRLGYWPTSQRNGTREIMLRGPDTRAFVLLFEPPR